MSAPETRLWGGRFGSGPAEATAALSRSTEADFALTPYDCAGSIAHATELVATGVLSEAEAASITSALERISTEFVAGSLRPQPADEDVHTFVERVLVERLGEVGGKLRAGRSRNDQTINDLRLFLRDQARGFDADLLALVTALTDQAEAHTDAPVPGFTHLQAAQPVTFGHQLLAHAHALLRDHDRLVDWDRRAAVCPLGAAALAGSVFAKDPGQAAASLGYDASFANSIDAVAARDAVSEFLYVAAQAFVDLSRLAEEVTLWSSHQFGWIRLDDRFATGSSIMPQKKNPDLAELSRGRAGRLIGQLAGFLAVVKGLPLAYDRDLSEDKIAAYDAVWTTRLVLPAMTGLVATMGVDVERMRRDATVGFTLATEAADYLVRRGVPFAQAHTASGALVRHCEQRGIGFDGLTAEDLATVDSRFGADLLPALTLEAALAAHDAPGGTAPARVVEQIAGVRTRIDAGAGFAAGYAGPRFPLG